MMSTLLSVSAAMGVFDQLDDAVVARQNPGEKALIPTLQSFRQQGVIGVAKTVAGDCNRLTHRHVMLIHQYPHQFRACDCRMRVVQLDGHVVGQRFKAMAF